MEFSPKPLKHIIWVFQRRYTRHASIVYGSKILPEGENRDSKEQLQDIHRIKFRKLKTNQQTNRFRAHSNRPYKPYEDGRAIA